jgi:IMP dehydrogenase
MDVEIGRGKKGRRAYGFDDIAIVPSRRTRDPDDIDIAWTLGPYRFELPLLAAAMDGVVSPRIAGIVGGLGGLAVLNLEGIWTRYEDPEAQLERIAALPPERATQEMQRIYQAPVIPDLIAQRVREIKAHGVVAAASLTPQRVMRHYELALDAGLDVLVIQGTVISAEHVSTSSEPLNLKEFTREVPIPVVVGGCASYSTGLHLMRTGAVGVLVGVGPGAACTTRGVLGIGVPQATAIADVQAARSQHMLETGEYVNVIADGGMRTGGDVAKAFACGADAVMIGSPLARAYEAPGRGYHWGMATFHPALPRGARVSTVQNGTVEQILLGPAHENDGTFNLIGSLRTSMATCGYEDIASFHRAEVMVAPSLQTEGKQLQRDQAIGMGARGAAAAPSPSADGSAGGEAHGSAGGAGSDERSAPVDPAADPAPPSADAVLAGST